MRRRLLISICWAGLLPGAAARGEIIDRIAVSVGNRVITETDLDGEVRLTAFLNGTQPDFSPENKRQTAERMVDQALVRAELEVSRYLLPTEAETGAALKEVKNRFPDEEAYRRALVLYGITEAGLKTMLLWQLTLVHFIDVRFRPGIQIGDEEIRNYFNEHLRPSLDKLHPGQPLSLDDYRQTIEQTLAMEVSNQQVEQWLKQARQRTHIQYHEEVFR